MNSFFKAVETVPSSAAHAVGIGSGVSGLALYAELAKHLTVIAGLLAVSLTILGGAFYASYWGLKSYARWKRIQRGDFSE